MRALIDAQLPPALVAELRRLGHDVQHVRDVGLRHATERQVWDTALGQRWIILTKDEDFAIRRRRENQGPVVVWLRVGNCSRAALVRWLLPLLASIEQLVADGETLIEVR